MQNEMSFGKVRFLPGRNQGRYPCCHSVYIEEAKVLIDPACDRKRLARLREEEGVEQVWLSHWHEDHIRNLDLFDDLPFFMSEKDAPPLTDLETFMDWYMMEGENVRGFWREELVNRFHYHPRTPAGFLHGGQVIELPGLAVEVIEAPGHTPGSLAFLFREPEVLFMSDCDLTRFGPFYGELFASIPEVLATIDKLRRVPAKVWMAGHETGLFTEQPGQLWDDYAGVVHARQGRLDRVLASPKPFREIVESWVVYRKPREPREFYLTAEAAMIRKHFEWMREQGRLREEDGLFSLAG